MPKQQELLTNSRMTYLAGNESATLKTPGNISTKGLKNAQSAEGQVFERLAKQAEIYHKIQKKKRDHNDNDIIDHKTGNEYFKPQINQNFYVRDRPDSSHKVTLNLYDRHKMILEKKQRAVNDEIRKAADVRDKNSKANKHSKQIVANSRQKKINEIFNLLDEDNDGEISWANIDLTKLSPGLTDVFKPLFDELEQIQEPLDREEFTDATIRLYNVSKLFSILNIFLYLDLKPK